MSRLSMIALQMHCGGLFVALYPACRTLDTLTVHLIIFCLIIYCCCGSSNFLHWNLMTFLHFGKIMIIKIHRFLHINVHDNHRQTWWANRKEIIYVIDLSRCHLRNKYRFEVTPKICATFVFMIVQNHSTKSDVVFQSNWCLMLITDHYHKKQSWLI